MVNMVVFPLCGIHDNVAFSTVFKYMGARFTPIAMIVSQFIGFHLLQYLTFSVN